MFKINEAKPWRLQENEKLQAYVQCPFSQLKQKQNQQGYSRSEQY